MYSFSQNSYCVFPAMTKHKINLKSSCFVDFVADVDNIADVDAILDVHSWIFFSADLSLIWIRICSSVISATLLLFLFEFFLLFLLVLRCYKKVYISAYTGMALGFFVACVYLHACGLFSHLCLFSISLLQSTILFSELRGKLIIQV